MIELTGKPYFYEKNSILEKKDIFYFSHEKIQLNIPEDGLNKSAELMNIWKKTNKIFYYRPITSQSNQQFTKKLMLNACLNKKKYRSRKLKR
jgi:hypothetical protein